MRGWGFSGGPRATLNLLPVGGGQPKTLFSEDRNALVERPARSFRFSPDGKFVSFARRNKQAFDIFLLPIGGGEPIPITDHPADDGDPIWAPDGKTLLFLSNRSLGREDIWALSIVDGKPSGEPFLVKSDVGNAQLLSLSNNGRLLFARGSGMSHIYSVAIDAQTQQPSAPAVQLTKDSPAAQNRWPAWSPDGKRIAYISSPGPARERELVLRLMSADGGNDREIISFHKSDNDPLAWSPDNDHVYFSGRQPGTGVGIYSISTSTRELKPALLGAQPVAHLSCSPDGSQLAFVRTDNIAQIFLADADGKNVRQITFDDSMSAFYPTWSPNGKQIAFYRYVRSGGARMGLMILTLEGGALTEVVGGARGSSELYNFWEPSWSPDGSHIVFAAPGPTSKPWGLPGAGLAPILWLTKLPNGKPEPFGANLGPSETISYLSPSWSPDGTKMLFSAETNVYQLLLMENFLPALKAAGKQ
jgi:Tol biopolymer transport system component